MSDKVLADIICRALLAIVVAIRKRYGLPNYRNIDIIVQEKEEDLLSVGYNMVEMKE
jgi:hypothetical protein